MYPKLLAEPFVITFFFFPAFLKIEDRLFSLTELMPFQL